MGVTAALHTLESAGLVRLARWQPELEYLFRHALVRDAAYASLPATDQARLHGVVGRAVEVLYSDRLEEQAGGLARHFELAGEKELARAYYLRAGRASLASFANQEAAHQFRSALALDPPLDQEAALLSGLGEALYAQSRYHDAVEAWDRGIAAFRALGDADGAARLYARSARAAWYAGDTPGGLRLCEEGLAATVGAAETVGQARLIHEAARACHFNGQPDRALPLCRQALQMAERLGAVDVMADALTTLGILPGLQVDEALASLREAVKVAEGAGLLETAVRANHNLGTMALVFMRDLPEARQCFLRAVEWARRRGAASEVAYSLLNAVGISLQQGEIAAVQDGLAELEGLRAAVPSADADQIDLKPIRAALAWMQGEHDGALRLLREAREEARRRGDLQNLASACTSLAEILTEMFKEGRPIDWSEVESAVQEAIELAERGMTGRTWPACELAMARAYQGRLDEARRLLVRARERAETRHGEADEPAFQTAEAILSGLEGRWEEALSAAQAVAQWWEGKGRRFAQARVLQEWADLHLGRGEPADLGRAESLLRESRDIHRLLGAAYYAARAEERLRAVRARIFSRALAMGAVSVELATARRIQEGLLPEEPPRLSGWELAARLEPAKETSGDFYDFVPLPGGRWGLVIADVVDKGAGAALYMALSRTLIRDHAGHHPEQPERTLCEVNRRILTDTHTDLFVTLFYGILDPEASRLTYCNAGQHPPYLVRGSGERGVQTLERTGPPVGILDDAVWEERTLNLAPGDLLLLYTDGVTDAQRPDGGRYGRSRLLEFAQSVLPASAPQVLDAVLDDVHGFVGAAPQFDDLTLMVVARA